MNLTEPDRNPVEALAEEFIARYRAGENPSVTDYVERYPEHAEEIADLFPAATLLEELKGPPRGALAHEGAAPRQLGDYRIVREIGRGGMGVVYEAEQVSLRRRVALKLLPPRPHLGPGQLERFQREARAAGRLHHTNIVPVFGVGEHEGQHYYVMQLIAGKGLDGVLAELGRVGQEAAGPIGPIGRIGPIRPIGPIGPAAPLHGFPSPSDPAFYSHVARLGAQAADALAYAHAQGIVHRDVKPANLLLDHQGTLWITDFGLAKLLEQDDVTRQGEMACTVRYSAPERFQGRSDARGDLFSLGLTLYELLALRPAYDEADPARLLVQVTKGHMVRPRVHNPAIPRDLETIVLKTLAPEPAGRYQSAAELADDLRRFLDDRPIQARRTSAIEHAWRWCRRNPAVAGLSAALVLVFLLGFSGVAWKWREASAHLALATEASTEATKALGREEQQRRRAEEQRQLAEGNLDLALKAFERIAGRLSLAGLTAPVDAGDEEGPAQPVVSPEAAAILEDLVGFYERFAATNSNDPRLRRDTGQALRQVGAIRLRLGQYAQAEEALRKAGELLDGLVQPLERARLHNELAVVLRAARRPGDAVREHQKALDVLRGIKDASAEVRHEQARAHNLLGAVQWRQQRAALAEKNQRTALAMLEKLVQEEPKSPAYRHTQARAYHDLSVVLWPGEQRPEAMEARTKAVEILEGLAAEHPGVPDYRSELAEILLSLPRVPGPRPFREAQRRSTRALELSQELAKKYPAVPDYQLLLARSSQRLGMLQAASGRGEEGVANIRKAIALHRDLQKRFPEVLPYRWPRIEAQWMLGETLRRQKDLAGSEKVLRESLAELEKLAAEMPRVRFVRALAARHYRSLAQTLLRQGKKSEADEAGRKAEEWSKAGS
jgi:serine/threonine protein kinase